METTMTLVFMGLAIAACIGWALHARALRHALHKAWTEIETLENCNPRVAPPAFENVPRINDLRAKFDAKSFSLADFKHKRSDLERLFLAVHGTHAEDIDIAIRRGVLPCTDPLVEEWMALELQALQELSPLDEPLELLLSPLDEP